MKADIIDNDGIHLTITTYTASNGVALTVAYSYFASAVAAQEYFEKVMNRSIKISERGQKKDKAGKVVGERAEVIVSSGSGNQSTPAIVLTFGPHFYEIDSGSSSTSRVLEKRLTSSN